MFERTRTDCLGRTVKTETAAAGTRTFAYDEHLRLESETITGLINHTITRAYYSAEVPGRSTGFTLATDESTPDSPEYAVAYRYDAYEPHRNLKTLVENAFGPETISRYEYEYDTLGRRTTVLNTSAAFDQPAFEKYGYDDRSQLVSATRYLGSDISDTDTPVDDRYRDYACPSETASSPPKAPKTRNRPRH